MTAVRAATSLVQLGLWGLPLYLGYSRLRRWWDETARRRAARRRRHPARPVTPAVLPVRLAAGDRLVVTENGEFVGIHRSSASK